jgi:hypothetical protein
MADAKVTHDRTTACSTAEAPLAGPSRSNASLTTKPTEGGLLSGRGGLMGVLS